MTEAQLTILEFDKNDYTEADFMSRNFVNAETRSRAYINVLSAELFTSYLAENDYQTEDIVSMHSISKVLEDVDIADVLLPNVHLDVRAVFEEDKIFIPKSHFELNITPDIYIVLKLAKNLKEATLLGYFKPSQVNKKYENKDYYFFPKEKLSKPETLLDTLATYKTEKDQKLEAREFLKGRALSVGLSDHCLNTAERKELYRLMLADSMLRDSVAEFDNFEVLSNQVSAVLQERIEIKEQRSKATPGITALTTEEIFKEGVKAVIEEKTAEAAEVFKTTTDVVETVQDVANTVEKVADVFETAPTEEQQPEKEPEENKNSEQDTQDNNEPEDSEKTPETTLEEPVEENKEIVDEEEFTIGDIDDELALDEDMQLGDIDTLDSEEVENSVEETMENSQEPAETETSKIEEEQVEASEEEQQQVDIEEDKEIVDKEEFTIGDIDDDLALDEDLQLGDIDTLDSEEVENSSEEAMEDSQEPAETETSEIVEEQVEASEEEQPEVNIEEDKEIVDEEEFTIGDIDDELALDEDLQLGDIDTLDSEEVENSSEEVVQAPSEPVAEIQSTVPVLDEPKTEPVVKSISPTTPAEFSIDKLLDNAIAAIDENKAAAPNMEVQEKVSDIAIKLTSVAGGAVENLVVQAEKKQSKNLEKIDFHQAVDNLSPQHTNDQMSFIGGLSDAKRHANMLAEAQGLTEKPTDLSELNVVEVQQQEEIVHEVVDIENIQTVEKEEFVEDDSQIVELEQIKDVDSPTKPANNIEDLALESIETETMELPDLNSYTINEDGTSPLDNMNWGPEEEINPNDLLDLDVAESLIGGATNMAQTDFTDDLVDSSVFKTQNTTTNEEITITEEENIEDETLDLNEYFTDEVEENTNIEENTEVTAEISPTSSTPTDEDELFGELLEDSIEEPIEESVEEPVEEVQAGASQEPEKEDWESDTGFDTLTDIEPSQNNDNDIDSTIIEESPETAMFKATSNSAVISDKTFTPGEIKIDINKNQTIVQESENNDTIESLYDANSTVATNTILNNPGRVTPQVQQPKRGIVAGLGIAGVLVTLVLLFAFGFGVSKFLKGSVDETPQPISDEGGNVSSNYVPQETTQQPSGQVVEMDNNTNALASTAGTTTSDKTTFVEVKKLSWEVPGAVSAEPKFQQYFQSAGKSLKSALMTDLLSVSDKAYASEMRVSVTFNQDGTFKDARIVTASGSNQIDNIVLRTVNQTLNVLKAPHSVGSYENTTAVLKIYL